jgi:hypothetical protein
MVHKSLWAVDCGPLGKQTNKNGNIIGGDHGHGPPLPAISACRVPIALLHMSDAATDGRTGQPHSAADSAADNKAYPKRYQSMMIHGPCAAVHCALSCISLPDSFACDSASSQMHETTRCPARLKNNSVDRVDTE